MDLRSTLSGRWRSMRDAKRVDRLDEEKERLRAELRMTKSQLDRERDHEREMLDALNRASQHKTKVTAKPRGGLFQMAVVAGAAYLFGSRAGRERYEAIRERSTSMLDRWFGRRDDVDTSSPGMGPRPNPLTESGIRRKNAMGSFETSRSRRTA
jgi:hypothetical protein